MVLEWLGGARAESIDELVRRKRYGRAVKLLRAELEKRKNDRRLRLRLGEILVLAGEREDGLRLLSNVADDLALSGQVAQAIAVLKKIETLDPGREEVEEKLAYLVEQRGRPFDPWKQSRDSLEDAEGRGEDGSLEIGFEPSPRAEAAVPPGSEDGPPAEPADPASAVEDVSEETLRGEILALIEETLNPLMAGSAGSPPVAGTEGGAGAARDASSSEVTPQGDEGVVDTPLFRSFTRAELVALIRGLRLLVFEPGQIIVSEGEAGASLFVLTSGAVRAYVRNDAQQQVQVRRLEEGDFFGEISVLSGAPRSATVTAASRCELLELDKPTLDRIAEGHPHVRQVLQEFYDRRKDNTLETLSRSMRVPDR